MAKPRGPAGSVYDVPAEEVTAVLLDVVTVLTANGQLDFERTAARRVLEGHGIEGEVLEGFLFALQRSIPGIVNTGYGTYRLPEDWFNAVRHRMWRFSAPKLDILEAQELLRVVEGNIKLRSLAARLRAELEAIR